jgi:hypothetical protein
MWGAASAALKFASHVVHGEEEASEEGDGGGGEMTELGGGGGGIAWTHVLSDERFVERKQLWWAQQLWRPLAKDRFVTNWHPLLDLRVVYEAPHDNLFVVLAGLSEAADADVVFTDVVFTARLERVPFELFDWLAKELFEEGGLGKAQSERVRLERASAGRPGQGQPQPPARPAVAGGATPVDLLRLPPERSVNPFRSHGAVMEERRAGLEDSLRFGLCLASGGRGVVGEHCARKMEEFLLRGGLSEADAKRSGIGATPEENAKRFREQLGEEKRQEGGAENQNESSSSSSPSAETMERDPAATEVAKGGVAKKQLWPSLVRQASRLDSPSWDPKRGGGEGGGSSGGGGGGRGGNEEANNEPPPPARDGYHEVDHVAWLQAVPEDFRERYEPLPPLLARALFCWAEGMRLTCLPDSSFDADACMAIPCGMCCIGVVVVLPKVPLAAVIALAFFVLPQLVLQPLYFPSIVGRTCEYFNNSDGVWLDRPTE